MAFCTINTKIASMLVLGSFLLANGELDEKISLVNMLLNIGIRRGCT